MQKKKIINQPKFNNIENELDRFTNRNNEIFFRNSKYRVFLMTHAQPI